MQNLTGLKIKELLLRNHLSQIWLQFRLEQWGILTDSTELSAALSGRRKGPKAEQLVETSLKIVEDYERRMSYDRTACN